MPRDPRPMDSKPVEIFTDGACSGNPGPGGWGTIFRIKKAEGENGERELPGGDPATPNNRMGLEALKRPCRVRLFTDSIYVRDGVTKWIHGWKKNSWRTADKKPVKNVEL